MGIHFGTIHHFLDPIMLHHFAQRKAVVGFLLQKFSYEILGTCVKQMKSFKISRKADNSQVGVKN